MAPGPNDPHAPPARLPAEVAARLLAFVEHTSDLVGMTDDAGRIVYLNDAARRRMVAPPGGEWPTTTADLFTEEAFATYFEEIRPAILRGEAWSGELQARTAAGDLVDVWVTVAGHAEPGGEVTWLVMAARDITERLAAEAELSRRATHDELTDLAGRGLLFERIELALHRARRTGGLAAVLFIDVNHLKVINDRMGHHAGDELLVQVSRRLQHAVRTIDTVARVGGDEFVVLLDGLAAADQAATLATRIQAAVETAPVRAGDAEVNVSVSMGVAVSAGEDDTDVAALIRRADAAMYDAKRSRHGAPGSGGDDSSVYDVAVAVTQLAVRPWYQPVFRMAGEAGGIGAFEGFQVLARWLRPDGVVLPAAEFVPGVDGTGVAFSLDLAVLREATRAVAALDRSPAPRVWAHLSSRSLRTPDADHFIDQILEHCRFDPARLSLEIADDLAVAPGGEVGDAVERLGALGVRVVVTVTDLGQLVLVERAGVSPLISELRLGPAVMTTLWDSPQLVTAVVEHGHARGWRIHLSGIESAADLARAAAVGIDLVSGAHLGGPAPEPNPSGGSDERPAGTR
jgi:diguanylate cyclase (GGDEF)-like protein